MSDRGLPGLVRPDHERPPRRDQPGGAPRSTGSSSAVLANPRKQPLLPADERVVVIRDALREAGAPGGSRIDVQSFDGLTVEFCHAVGAGFIVRGLRAISDFETEMQLAHNNRRLAPRRRHGLLHDRDRARLRLVEPRQGDRVVRRRRVGDDPGGRAGPGPRALPPADSSRRPGPPRGPTGEQEAGQAGSTYRPHRRPGPPAGRGRTRKPAPPPLIRRRTNGREPAPVTSSVATAAPCHNPTHRPAVPVARHGGHSDRHHLPRRAPRVDHRERHGACP